MRKLLVGFNGDRLRIARAFHNYTQRDLGEQVAVSPALISQYERNLKEPEGDILEALADALAVYPDYFFAPLNEEFVDHQCSFRRQAAASERLRRKVLAHGTLFGLVVQHLARQIRWPELDIPFIRVENGEDIEKAADQCREHWNLGYGPILNIGRVLENAGLIVTVLNAESVKVDAFARFGEINMVALNNAKGSGSRMIFDCAHELGHAVLHRGDKTKSYKQKEDEANYFGGAFLLPSRSFAPEYWSPLRRNWDHLMGLKQRWGASIGAMVERARQLGLINAAEYRIKQKYISRQGWRRGGEPCEPDPLRPELFRVALDKFLAVSGNSLSHIADELSWTPQLFQRITGVHIPNDAEVHSLEEYRMRRATG